MGVVEVRFRWMFVVESVFVICMYDDLDLPSLFSCKFTNYVVEY